MPNNERRPYLNHINNNVDLITTHNAIRSGFLEMALERNRKANPVILQAKNLRAIASGTQSAVDLVNVVPIQDALLTASGFSDKAKKFVSDEDKPIIINEFIREFLIPAGDSYIDELVFRFLITKGDSIGGSLRNLAGKLAYKKFSNSIISALTLFQYSYCVKIKGKNQWMTHLELLDSDDSITAISWTRENQNRTLAINVKIPQVDKNIDICILNCDSHSYETAISRSPESFLALGELKGGIDPAGADEHWKTARTAFNRIRQAFSILERFPYTFFIGAAIENSMSREIWDQLESGTLTNAANLTKDDQLSSITNWICLI